jgi:hypothetical protein
LLVVVVGQAKTAVVWAAVVVVACYTTTLSKSLREHHIQ